MANQFYIEPAQFGQGLQSLAGSVQQFGQQQRAQEKAAEQEAYTQRAKQAMSDAFQSGDPRKIMQVGIQFPEVSETMQQLYGFTNEQTEQAAKEGYRRFLGTQDPAERLAILEGTVDTISQLGGRPVLTQQDVERYKRDPEGTAKSIEMAYAGIDPKGYEALSGGSKGPSIGTYNPRDYTTESFAEFTRTGDPAVLERYAAQRTVDIGGVPHVFDPARGGYYPASVSGGPRGGAAGRGGQATGGQDSPVTAETVAESRETIVRGEERARLESALAKEGYRLDESGQLAPIPGGKPAQEQQQAQEAEKEQTRQAFQKADVMTNKIDASLEQVDWDSAGAVGQFLQFVGGTPARDLSANLETIQANLGFDALQDMRDASPTGGALGQVTEKEIRFLQGLIESLDQAQSPAQLRSNLQQLRSGVQKTRGMLSGEISVLESEDQLADLEDGQEYVLANDPARQVQVKGGMNNIMRMSRSQLDALNPSDLTEEQLQQAARRYDQLGAQ